MVSWLSDSQREDAYIDKGLGTSKCGRGWVGVRGNCKRAKRSRSKAALKRVKEGRARPEDAPHASVRLTAGEKAKALKMAQEVRKAKGMNIQTKLSLQEQKAYARHLTDKGYEDLNFVRKNQRSYGVAVVGGSDIGMRQARGWGLVKYANVFASTGDHGKAAEAGKAEARLYLKGWNEKESRQYVTSRRGENQLHEGSLDSYFETSLNTGGDATRSRIAQARIESEDSRYPARTMERTGLSREKATAKIEVERAENAKAASRVEESIAAERKMRRKLNRSIPVPVVDSGKLGDFAEATYGSTPEQRKAWVDGLVKKAKFAPTDVSVTMAREQKTVKGMEWKGLAVTKNADSVPGSKGYAVTQIVSGLAVGNPHFRTVTEAKRFAAAMAESGIDWTTNVAKLQKNFAGVLSKGAQALLTA